MSVYSRGRDGGILTPIFLRIPPNFSEAGGKFYIEKEGKRSSNVITSHLSIKNPPCFLNPRKDTGMINTMSSCTSHQYFAVH
jgi:hypothetical protein